MAMRVLITGGGGHVGRALAALVQARGDAVVLLDCAAPDGQPFIAADVADAGAVKSVLDQEKPDMVFHLAGLGAASRREEMDRVNIDGTAAVLDAARDARVVVMSSSAVYGAASDDPITEETALAPAGAYGASKVATEELARAAAARSQWVAIARPFNIVGPGQRAPMLQTAVLKQLVAIERGLQPPVLTMGWLGNSRDFVDARDVAAGLVAIGEKGFCGQAYNLCSGEATKVRALVEMLVQMIKKDVVIQDDTGKPASDDVAFQRGSADRLQQASGWRVRIPFEQSLADSLAWQRGQP